MDISLNTTNYQSFKGRQIDFSQPVEIYKNLHNGLFSVRQNGLVVAHVESFSLSRVFCKVSETGRQKVIREQKKNVHAFLCGYLLEVNCIGSDNGLFEMLVHNHKLTYNPYKGGHFVKLEQGQFVGTVPNNVIHMGVMAHVNHGMTYLQY